MYFLQQKIIQVFFLAYRVISAILRAGQPAPLQCRFTPSCSQYSEHAVFRFGLKKGFLLSLRRFLRCRPFGARGFDPLPEKEN